MKMSRWLTSMELSDFQSSSLAKEPPDSLRNVIILSTRFNFQFSYVRQHRVQTPCSLHTKLKCKPGLEASQWEVANAVFCK